MCRLFGSIGFPPDPARIAPVAHRGPDGQGWQVFGSPAGAFLRAKVADALTVMLGFPSGARAHATIVRGRALGEYGFSAPTSPAPSPARAAARPAPIRSRRSPDGHRLHPLH